METITVNGKMYYSEQSQTITGDLKIVVLQRGWVLIGTFEQNGDKCKLHNAAVIRNWGTTKGLGELVDGPTVSTKLDKCHGVVEFHELTIVLSISAREEKWIGKL
jgi:hypothetical protein